MNNKLDKDRIREVALAQYRRRHSFFDLEDFEADFNDLAVARKMVSRFLTTDVINEKMILNKIITSVNVFGAELAEAMFFSTCTAPQFAVIKACMIYQRTYTFKLDESIDPHRVMVDILKDMNRRGAEPLPR